MFRQRQKAFVLFAVFVCGGHAHGQQPKVAYRTIEELMFRWVPVPVVRYEPATFMDPNYGPMTQLVPVTSYIWIKEYKKSLRRVPLTQTSQDGEFYGNQSTYKPFTNIMDVDGKTHKLFRNGKGDLRVLLEPVYRQ